ncbi:MAG: thioredoxin domain-containing protein, partial [Polyangia bacterium]|nr:thioredoxin domain-containing protein [Polyangia bacterium]
MSQTNQPKTEGVPIPTVVISVIAVFVAGLLIGGFVLRFGKKGDKDCDCGPAGAVATAEKRYKIFPRPHNPSKGPRTAPVTIIEASDFQCPHCSNAVEILNKISAAYPQDVRIVFMHNPLPNHPDAMTAAVASLAANQQGKFWPYHELLFKNPRALKKPDLDKYAKQVGLNVEQFEKEFDNRRLQIQVRQDQQ